MSDPRAAVAEVPSLGTAAERARADILVLGMFPPPTTGAAKNTLLMLETLRSRGAAAVGVSTSTGRTALSRSFAYHVDRAGWFVRTLARVRRTGFQNARARTVYMVPDGGQGLWYSLGYLALGLGRLDRIVLHHRTFQYLDRPHQAMRAIVRRFGDRTTHVFLSRGMQARFEAAYGPVSGMIATNARYVEPRRVKRGSGPIVVGHLSNLCRDKGFHDVVAAFERIAAHDAQARLLLAGPVLEDAVTAAIARLNDRYPGRIGHLGPVHGAAKDAFYDRTDLFLFPTRWAQEAQPNVVYEAFAAGCAVVANARGCIGEMIDPALGEAVTDPDRFADRAAHWAGLLAADPARRRSIAERAVARMLEARDDSLMQHAALEALLLDGAGASD